jgi:hypothetical protein
MSPQAKLKIDALGDMTTGELQEKYLEVYGEPARTRNKPFLMKRIAWRIQALEEGELSERARQRAFEIANDADLRVLAPRQVPTRVDPENTVTGTFEPGRDRRLPLPGTILKRKYKGRIVRAMVMEDGFEFEGEVFDSLSAIATKVAGTRWNGYQFFGLNRKEVGHAG